MQIEPIEKDVPVAVCEACGEVIFKGDSAYLIEREIVCVGCVEAGRFIADDAENAVLPSVCDEDFILKNKMFCKMVV